LSRGVGPQGLVEGKWFTGKERERYGREEVRKEYRGKWERRAGSDFAPKFIVLEPLKETARCCNN